MRALHLALAAALLAGCSHSHHPRNAPGNVDLLRRPESPRDNPSLPPSDPGEQSVITSIGPSGGLVVASGQRDGDPKNANATAGAELSLAYGQNRFSHHEDGGGLDSFFPRWRVGLNLGLLAASRDESWGPRAYTEVQYSFVNGLLGLAGGWQSDFDRRQGPQFTLNAGPLYLRSATHLDLGTDLELGLIFKLPVHAWVSSQ